MKISTAILFAVCAIVSTAYAAYIPSRGMNNAKFRAQLKALLQGGEEQQDYPSYDYPGAAPAAGEEYAKYAAELHLLQSLLEAAKEQDYKYQERGDTDIAKGQFWGWRAWPWNWFHRPASSHHGGNTGGNGNNGGNSGTCVGGNCGNGGNGGNAGTNTPQDNSLPPIASPSPGSPSASPSAGPSASPDVAASPSAGTILDEIAKNQFFKELAKEQLSFPYFFYHRHQYPGKK